MERATLRETLAQTNGTNVVETKIRTEVTFGGGGGVELDVKGARELCGGAGVLVAGGCVTQDLYVSERGDSTLKDVCISL